MIIKKKIYSIPAPNPSIEIKWSIAKFMTILVWSDTHRGVSLIFSSVVLIYDPHSCSTSPYTTIHWGSFTGQRELNAHAPHPNNNGPPLITYLENFIFKAKYCYIAKTCAMRPWTTDLQ